jgi:methionyl-tRNA synthetase
MIGSMSRFYITTAIVYTNASPHIGFALELLQADALARYRRMMGDEVRFVTGTDEHGTKIMRAALHAGVPTQRFVDDVAAQVGSLCQRLSISNTDFVRTSDQVRHWPAAQALWRKMAEKGDLYKKSYDGYYCVGHEAFVRQSELVDGVCPLHKTTPERIQEENWFFKLSAYRDQVRELLESGKLAIVPETRKGEILNLLKDAEDVSFSRPSEQLSWGIPVPGDPTQTMYVWADALTNYISALGYGAQEDQMDFWPADVHIIGKDILRFHAMIWPAMLLSAGLAVPKAVYVHGFITVDGQKMSKSLGNVINPLDLLEQFPVEVIRYLMLRELQSTEDSDFSWKNLESRYTSDLANGLGNLVQRTATLIQTKLEGKAVYKAEFDHSETALTEVLDDTLYHEAFQTFRLHDALGSVWAKIGVANAYINDYEPWKQEGEAREKTLAVAATMIGHIAWLLQPFMPETAKVIGRVFGVPLDVWKDGQIIATQLSDPLFPRRG